VVTAGSDGFIKWFDLNYIANTEPDDTLTLEVKQIYALQVTSKESNIGNLAPKSIPAYIVSILQGADHWLIGDGRGKIWMLNNETKDYKPILRFHSGKVMDLALSQDTNSAVSIGNDGCLKLWDYTKSMEVYTRQFNGEGRCVDWMARNAKNKGRIMASGFANGIVRILLLGNQNFQLLTAFKALDEDIVKVGYSQDCTCFVAAGAGGSLFFFDISDKDLQKYEPVCLTELKQKINDMRWHKDNKRLLVACENGTVVEVLRPDKSKIDTKSSYVVSLPTRMWTIKMMESQMKKNQQKDESEE
jgi:WD40 repeat protein